MKSTSLLAMVVLMLSLDATASAAEPAAGAKAVAAQMFDDAQGLMANGKQEDWGKACAKYAESQKLDPQLGTLLHLADCYSKIGKTASAWASFKDAIEIAAHRHDGREAAARARLAEIEPQLCRLTITVDKHVPSDLEISSNGSIIGSALLGSPIPVDPGEYILKATAEGFEDWTKGVVIAPGTANTLVDVPALVRTTTATVSGQIPPLPTPSMPAPIATTSVEQSAAKPAGTDSIFARRGLMYALGGVGVVGVGIGVGFGLAMEAKVSDRDAANACSATRSCTPDQRGRIYQLSNEASSRATVANIGFAAGGVALAAGAVLVAVEWSKSKPPTVAQVQPWVGDKAAGFVAGGSW